jgi:hypothetical protein
MAKQLSPEVGTAIKGEGSIVFHDVTAYDLHRLCVSVAYKYPDLETWCELLKDKQLKAHRYTEKMAQVFIGYLWLYWKDD